MSESNLEDYIIEKLMSNRKEYDECMDRKEL